jgi:hypothetical protein
MNARTSTAAAVGLLLVALAVAATSLWRDALVIDEVAHITAGYSYARTGSLRLNPEHPPLVKEIAGLPLLALGLNEAAFLARFREVAVEDQWRQGRMFLYHSGNDPARIARVARLAVLAAFYVPAALLVFFWARARYGPWPALLALVLFAFSPTVLAHARLVTTDVASAGGALAVVLSWAAWCRRPTRASAALAVLALGVALLIKYSAVLLVPYVVMVGAVHGALQSGRWSGALRGLARSLGLAALSFLLVVCPYYHLHLMNWSPQRQRQNTLEMLENTIGDGPTAQAILWASERPALRAGAQYAAGVMHVVKRTAARNRVFFMGRTRPNGTPSYFPVLYLLKEPLAWWVLVAGLAVAGVGIARRSGAWVWPGRAWLEPRFEEIAIASWVLLYWIVCLRTTLNLGVRHLLPTYPLAALLAAGAAAAVVRRLAMPVQRRAALAIAGLAALYAGATLSVHPSYLAFYNALAGGPDGGRRYAVDSNLDWGQDLLRLADWVRARGIEKIEVDYFGGGVVTHALGTHGFLTRAYEDPAVFRESEAELLARGESDGWIAVSITMLETALGSEAPSRYHWLATRPPEATIGHSILVWHLTAPPPGR